MRILGFAGKWPKLDQHEFTTFRIPREDKEWHEGEVVQAVFKPRSKNREILGTARIVSVGPRTLSSLDTSYYGPVVTEEEAMQDGFDSLKEMRIWLLYTCDRLKPARSFAIYGLEPINKLTLQWVEEKL